MARPWWPLDRRFKAKVKLDRESNGCLLWTGNKNLKGYGLILLDGTGTPLILATHAALILIDAVATEYLHYIGWGVFHTCDTPACVYTGNGADTGVYVVDDIEYSRWGHLWIGPKAANNKDMWNKRRSNWQNGSMPNSRGVNSVTAKLNDDLVRRIRLEYKYGGGSYTYLAKLHNVDIRTIQRAVERITWQHVA